ncbi:DNA gyrase subunit A [Candidatus Kaiserbacteria bacterium RIFCSPHIGHO2_01_FULL_48_10]|uniref:DNA gyrase subunit A n=1 Tax=Candidatus Kaiserbacteria bacterium RIFCSPHIGHO2_01_FULL_48_10 TaxID=1798476 RepID=A0A1F6C2P9_9BACT|nr:MAG: DNA gyrase subunit A [Candidatus Kaiserbacteria bacterium RIFCSPHIGHO2_01_FULL_48_10]
MPRKKEDNALNADDTKAPEGLRVVSRSITEEMRESYLDYAMSVITSRALPDVRDGLKPVHRRILYAMHELGLTPQSKFRKSAAVVGEVMAKYHPHGDSAIYDTLAKLAQDFTTRYPLIIGQGNFGSVDGDSPAAMRYTEAKMSALTTEILKDIEKETVLWRPNYDGTKKEPEVLPAAVPNILINGTLGIAVGMATNIPPHNLSEVIDACVHLIENPEASTEDLLEFVQGPDFPTGAVAYNAKDIAHAYATGRGPVVVRGVAEITEDKKGNAVIIITSIPFRVNKAELIIVIANLVREKKLEGIRDIRDESTKDTRIVIELKQNAQPQAVLNYLYKHTQLEEPFHYNMVVLVDGVPETLSLDGVLSNFIAHRKEVVKKRTEFDLSRAKDREHILLGLSKALDHIDEIIKLIKAAKDVPTAHGDLIKKFKFSERQATAILEMRLQKLAGLERKKIEDELAEVQSLIKELEEILSSAKKIMAVVKKELIAIKEKYGDERRTKIVKGGIKSFSMEDLVPDETAMLTITSGGYVKRTNPSEYKKQNRGGVGVVDLNTKDEDFVTSFLEGSTHDSILFFTDRGKVYRTKMYEVPEGKRATKGKSIMNVLPLSTEERVTSIVAVPKNASTASFMLVTEKGVAKKVKADQFDDVRKSGIIAMTLQSGDSLIAALPVVKGESVILVTSGGQAIRFKESDIREMGRSAAGVRAMKISGKGVIVGADVISNEKESEILVVANMGYGKRTHAKEYKVQKRGGSGIKTGKVTPKTGNIIAARVVTPEISEIIVASQKGQVIRTELKQIPVLSRATQGVRIMRLYEGDKIAAFTVF